MANGGEDSGVKGRDPAWKYCESIPTNKQATICNFCQLTLMSGGITRFKYHLSHTDPQKNARPCKNVPPEVKKEIRDQLRAKEIQKRKRPPKFDDIRAELQRGLAPNEEEDDEFVYPPNLDRSERSAYRSPVIQSRATEWEKGQIQNFEGRTGGRRGNPSEPPPHYHVPQLKRESDARDAIPSERTPTRVPEAGSSSIPPLVQVEGCHSQSDSMIIRDNQTRSPIMLPPAKRPRTDIVDVAALSEALSELAEASRRLIPIAEEQALRAETAEEKLARLEKELDAERQKRKEAEDEAAKAKAEVKDLKKEKSILKKSEGEILSTFLSKLLTTNTFSQFIQQCAVPLMENARAELLQKIMRDFPDLPQQLDEKYELLAPIDTELNYLTGLKETITPRATRNNKEDKDKDFDPIPEQLPVEKHASASTTPVESDNDPKVSGLGNPTD